MTQLTFLSTTEPQAFANLKNREYYREQYWHKRDPILHDRLLWRAQTFRHLVHLTPHKTILELGAGQGAFTRQLRRVSRGENPITSVTFNADYACPEELSASVEWLNLSTFPESVAGRTFDFVVVMELLDKNNYIWFFQDVYKLLKPGGQIVFYESNPWNIMLKLRRGLSKLFGQKDSRQLLERSQLYEVLSEVGFIRVFAVFNDFVYAPLTPSLVWLLRNLSILLENTPGIQTLAGSILIHAQKPPRLVASPPISLCRHEQLHQAVSVVIPCHNEEMNIQPLITQLKAFFNDYICEIIPVDDNSTDKTREVIQQLAQEDSRIKPVLRSPPNGVGRAIADGYRVATGKYILSMDCDFQHLLPEVRDLFDAAAEGYDVVVGSRFSRHSVLLNYPFAKIVVNRGFHVLAQILFRRRFRDLTNNLKLMRREIAEKLQLTLEFVRERLRLTGTKRSCESQVCGACTVLVDGEPISACTYLTFEASGKHVTTIEGLAPGGSLAPLQEAFIHRGAAQCGFCTAGMLLTCTALLQEYSQPTREQIGHYLNGNICRCGAYVQILEAIQDVAAARLG